MITLKSPSEVARMRESGRIVAEVLAILTEKAVPGATTAEPAGFSRFDLCVD